MNAGNRPHAARRLIAVTLILATSGGPMATVAQPLSRTAESADASHIVMASTTSTEQSGLFTHVLPRFTAKTGIQVRVVALGTGQAISVPRAVTPICCSSMTRLQRKNLSLTGLGSRGGM
jgi:spermidine/putrescine-binding protein